jgi:hypothetical protein
VKVIKYKWEFPTTISGNPHGVSQLIATREASSVGIVPSLLGLLELSAETYEKPWTPKMRRMFRLVPAANSKRMVNKWKGVVKDLGAPPRLELLQNRERL